MANNDDYDSIIERLQAETKQRLKKQDHTIAKLERKIDKLQEQNHSQMQIIDVRMQQMMGMFKMFMMNQSIGMNQNANQNPNMNQNQLQPTQTSTNGQNNMKLEQSKSALNLSESTTEHDGEHEQNTKQMRLTAKPKNIYKSRSIGNLDDSKRVKSGYKSHSDFDSDSDEELESYSRSREHSKSRKRHKRKSKKERKREKKERRREKRKKKKEREEPILEEDTTNVKNRAVPPPPPQNNKNGALPPKAPPNNNNTKSTIAKFRRDKEHSKSRSKRHEKSQSEDVKIIHHKKYKKKKQVNTLDFVPINTNYGNQSPTKSESGILDKLDALELDVDTPSDEESLLYLVDDQLDIKEDDSDIDELYPWNNADADADATKKKKKKRNINDDESGEDDDISILSLSKLPAAVLDGEDLGDSDYSGYDEAEGEEQDTTASDSSAASNSDSDNEKKKKKKERKKLKKQKKEKKRRKKELKKREKEKRRKQKEKNNEDSVDEKEKEENENKKRTTISKKIKQIGQKFKIGFKDNDQQSDKDKDNEIELDIKKIELENAERSKSTTFKDMFKGKAKAKMKGKINKEDSLFTPGRTQRAKTSAAIDEGDKKKKKIRSFKAREISSDKIIDDHLVEYGGDRNAKKSNSKPQRRGSDSNIGKMELLPTDSWYTDMDLDKKRQKKKRKKKKKQKFDINTAGMLQPDLGLDSNVTPPPSPIGKVYGLQVSDADEEDEDDEDDDEDEDGDEDGDDDDDDDNDSLEIEIDAKLEDEEPTNIKKHSSIDDYTKSRGSKSTSKDIIVSDDIERKAPDDNTYDPDIDVGDYNWNSYSVKTKTKTKPKPKAKTKPKSKSKSKTKQKGTKNKEKPKPKTKLKKTHSDEDIPIKKQTKNKSNKTKVKQVTRPHSARVGSNFVLTKKEKEDAKKNAFFKDKKRKNNANSASNKKDKKSKEKEKTVKKKKEKKKKPKNINIGKITEHKKLKQKKRKQIAMTPTVGTIGANRKKKKVNEDKKEKTKRGSARLWDGDKPKKKAKTKIETPIPEDQNLVLAEYADDKKEPEVLDHARGQSMHQALAISHSQKTSEKDLKVEYIFANKKLKSIVPKMQYDKYENDSTQPEFILNAQHVIGYMGYDALCRNNLYALNNGQLVYNAGCLAVIHDLERNEQKIYRYHNTPITSITVLESETTKEFIASSSNNTVRIWDKITLNTISEIKCQQIVGKVRHLSVSPSSGLLYLTCGENNKNINLLSFKVESEEANEAFIDIKFKAFPNKTVQIYGLIFNENVINPRFIDEFIVFGLNILYWCQVSKKNGKLTYCKIHKLQPKGLTDGKKEKSYQCGLFLNSSFNYYALGGESGTIYIGYMNTIIMSLSAHSARVQSIVAFNYDGNQFISIGHDGMWKIWDIDYDDDKMKEISLLIEELNIDDDEDNKDNDNDENEYEAKRIIPDYSNKMMKRDAISVVSEDTFVPSNDNISKYPHCAYYDINNDILYIGTACNSIVSVSCIDVKHAYGDNDVQIISSGHSLGVVGVAISPKLETLIATLSEDGLLRLWNIFQSKNYGKHKALKNKENKAKRLDNCVALQSLITQKQKQDKLKSTVIAWSPDGKYIATGYNVAKVSLCIAHPLKKVQEIDLTQYKSKGKNISSKQAITALCFSYDKNVLAVAHSNQISLFNVERNSNKKCTKWELTLNVYNTSKEIIKHLYFSQNDTLCVVSEKYDTKFYNVSMKKKSISEAIALPKADTIWWPRIPLTSYILKGLYQKDTMKWNKSELSDADICQSPKVAASADNKGIIRLHKLPALNQKAHNAFKHHHGQISKILFIPHQSILISVGLNDRSIIRWNINEL